MKDHPSIRYALALLALFLASACFSADSSPSKAASPPASSQPEPMRVPAPPKTGEQWQAGLHYSVILGRAKTDLPPGKVEVRELFMYTSPLSYEIQPYLAEWLKHKPEYVQYVRSPSIVFPHARLQARTYFTLEALGRDDLHQALFAWIFQKDHYPIYHTIEHPDEAGYLRLNREFAQANKLGADRFVSIYTSKEIEDKVIQAEIATHGYLVAGTSTFVVNGRYSTSVQRVSYPNGNIGAEDYKRLFSLIEYLAGSEAEASNLAANRQKD
jgi:thiol:disulfide interchange protein DsbA